MSRSGIILVFIASSLSLGASYPDIFFSGDFQNVPFPEFVQDVEAQSGAHFFYLSDWTTGINISATGEKLSLSDVLREHFSGRSLHFYIDAKDNVFITNDLKLKTELPDYQDDNADTVPGAQTGKTEFIQYNKDYLEGRTTGTLETLIIGKEDENNIQNRAIISGKILDQESGEPLIGASIYIEELKTGAVTDINGQFSLVLTPGKYSAMINCMGMKEIRYFLQVYSNGTLNVAMENRIIPINEVVIKADQFHNVRGIQMGFERLNIKTIKEIPVVMGEKDLLKVVQMLPGIQSVGEGSSGINVRGSPADQNIFYINKLPVYNPSHLFGFFSSFSPDIIKDFSFYKSNIPAKYGGRLASVFDISTSQGNKKEFTARGGISPVTGHIAVEGPIKKEHSSYVLSARSTYSDWLLSQLENPDLRNSKALFHDFTANVNIEANEKNLFRAFAYYSNDRFHLASKNQYQYANIGGSLGWRHRLTSSISADFTAIFSNYSFQTLDQTFPIMAYSHDYELNHYEFKSDLIWFIGQKHTLTFGGSGILYDLDRGNVSPYGPESIRIPVELGLERGLEGAVYIGDEMKLLPRLTLYSGLRYSFYAALGPSAVHLYFPDAPREDMNILDTLHFSSGEIVQSYSCPEPRLAINYSTGSNSSVKVSYNRIRQYLFMLSNTIAISPTDQWKLCDYYIKPPLSDQISAGFYKEFPGFGINTSIELYYKKTLNLVEFKDAAEFLASPNIETEVLQGNQSAYGMEVMVKKNAGKLNGWFSYAYSRSEVLVNGEFPWDKINTGIPYPSNYDKPHAINLVANYRTKRRLSFSANMVYSTGRPLTNPLAIYYVNGQPLVEYSMRNEYRIPDYFRIDLSINMEGTLKARKLAHSYWMINIYNLTGRENAYSVYYKSEEGKINGYKMSIFGIPIVTISWNLKLGNYASE